MRVIWLESNIFDICLSLVEFHFFSLCFFHLSIKAQVNKGFKWVGEDNTFFSIEKQKGTITKEAKNNEKIELGTIQVWDSIKKELPRDFDINVFVHKNKTLITVLGTGQLYELNLPKFTLNRLDKTFFRGYNFLASQFIRKDTLFSVGGEGFFFEIKCKAKCKIGI